MSGAIKKVGKVLDPGGLVDKTLGKATGISYTDPLGIADALDAPKEAADKYAAALEEERAMAAEEQQEAATSAAEATIEAKKKKKGTTQTVLTSPLGSTTTARTAVAKLGGY